MLYPFLKALRKISRAISFEHNAPFAVFLQENNSPLLGEKFRPTICERFLD